MVINQLIIFFLIPNLNCKTCLGLVVCLNTKVLHRWNVQNASASEYDVNLCGVNLMAKGLLVNSYI